MKSTRSYFNQLNQEYLQVHKAKEDLFWDIYMGTSDNHDGFARAEQVFKSFISDPAKLAEVRLQLSALASSPEGSERRDIEHGLHGWLTLFEANIIDNPAAERSQRELIEMEAALFA